jgi:hypothetical protein
VDLVVFVCHDDRDRNQCERVGRAVAHFAIDLLSCGRWRQRYRRYQFTWSQHRFDIRGVARRAIKRVDRDRPDCTITRDGLDPRI